MTVVRSDHIGNCDAQRPVMGCEVTFVLELCKEFVLRPARNSLPAICQKVRNSGQSNGRALAYGRRHLVLCGPVAMNLFLYVVTVLIWGTTWIAIKWQLGVVPRSVSIACRFWLAAIGADTHSREHVGPSDDGEHPRDIPKRGLIPPALEQLNRLAHAGVTRQAGNRVEVDARSQRLADAPRAMVMGGESQVLPAIAGSRGSFFLTCLRLACLVFCQSRDIRRRESPTLRVGVPIKRIELVLG